MQTSKEHNIEDVINISDEIGEVGQVRNPVSQTYPLDLLSQIFCV